MLLSQLRKGEVPENEWQHMVPHEDDLALWYLGLPSADHLN